MSLPRRLKTAWQYSSRNHRRALPSLAARPWLWRFGYLGFLLVLPVAAMNNRQWAQETKPHAVIGTQPLWSFWLIVVVIALLPLAAYLSPSWKMPRFGRPRKGRA